MQNQRKYSYEKGTLPPHMKLDINEAYAFCVLCFIDFEQYSGLVFSDKPDLRDVSLGLGVETTLAIKPEYNELDSLYEKARNTKDKKYKECFEQRIEALGGKIIPGGMAYPKSTDDFELILRAYEKKLERLNSGDYELFAHNQLFIRSDILASPEMLNEVLRDFCSLIKRGISFERVIVSVPHHNYIFNLLNRTYEDRYFSPLDQSEVAMQARRRVIDAEQDA